MAKEYRRVDRDQAFLLPPSMTDWLPGDHLVWFVIAAVDLKVDRVQRRPGFLVVDLGDIFESDHGPKYPAGHG